MMINIYVPVLLTILLFSLFTLNARRNKFDISDNIVELFLYSFGLSAGILLSISLIIYAVTENIILGLSNEMLHLGVFIGGATLLITNLKEIYSKFKKMRPDFNQN